MCLLQCVFVLCFLPVLLCEDILAVLPTPSKSHFNVFQPLLLALASRGHKVTVISSFPLTSPVQNYTDISVKDFKLVYESDIPFEFFTNLPAAFEDDILDLYNEIGDFERFFGHPEVKRLLTEDGHYDLIITEMWNTDMMLVFSDKFKAPVVTISSCYPYPWIMPKFGTYDNPSYVPTAFMHKMGKLGFRQRLQNIYQLIVSNLVYDFYYNPRSEEILTRALGRPSPSLDALARNISLILVNTHHSLHGAKPLSPNVIEIGGIHVQDPKPLPKDLDSWINDSPHGVVYFSFGSMLKGASLPKDKVDAFLQAFKTMPQRFLWKWEEEPLQNTPENVRMIKWVPQRDILAHSKCRLFISHGGLLGTTEAVVSGVPMLGIPFFADQPLNVAAMVEQGAALRLDFNNITSQSLIWAINTLLIDPRYSDNAKALSRRFLDRPLNAVDTAVYWTEYVMRQEGALHLQPVSVHLSILQLWLLDVVLFVVVSLTIITAAVVFVFRRRSKRKTEGKQKTN